MATIAKKFVNDPTNIVQEAVEGALLADPRLRKLSDHHVIVRHDFEALKDKSVAIISGGGSGHESMELN